MRFGHHEACLRHDPGHRHPESPDRLRAIRRELDRRHGAEYVAPDPVDPDRVAAVHDPDYVKEVEQFCADGGGQWDHDTVAEGDTWEAALASTGAAAWAAETALAGATGRETPFSLGRPPGHHAVADDAMGFCFFNNVAVAAAHAREELGADSVAVVDWDVHHGNGTQDIFYDRGDVFVCSIHERGLYPGTGAAEETGEGDGEGTTLNVPLTAGAGDAEYVAVLEDLVTPAVEAFDPDLLLVSSGFDAHQHDPISRMRVSTDGYGLLADRCRAAAEAVDAPVAFVLEGGYSLDALAESVATVHETFAGYRPVEPDEDPSGAVRTAIEDGRERLGID
ncbi:histone deacetylase [Halobacteriales archaeon QS_8_69_26]|nr:MAG: histone deacetylase [Halobacteriales archaeon QS_8_69_26]